MKCRHCGALLSLPFLDLGSAPPSNAYLTDTTLNAPETWYPLRVLVCQHCWLVQTEDHAGREALFNDDYAYFSSFSSSWLAHAQAYVAEMQQRFGLTAASRVVEVASNDGYLLQYVQAAGVPCYGIEPTASTAAAAKAKGIQVVERFFGVALAQELVAQGQQADLTAANNVLAHVPDINDFVAGFALLLKPQGVATFEFPHVQQMVQQCQFDTAYHEHYSYLSLTAVQRIFAANGLQVFDVQELPTHGGSLRVFAQRADSGSQPVAQAVQQVLQGEEAAGMRTPDFYSKFGAQSRRIARELLSFLVSGAHAGHSIAAYGAAAKGNTLLNFAGVRPHLLPYVVDKNPAKQGKYMPGSRIPIVDEAYLRAQQPRYVLILPWNLQAEVMEQLAYIRDWGGRFITAVPGAGRVAVKVLLTGASGYLGRHVLAHLRAQGCAVAVLGRSLPAGFEDVPLVRCDLLDGTNLDAAVQQAGATHLLHLAWTTEYGKYWTSPLNFRWADATLRLLRAFADAGGQHVAIAGSCAEYDWGAGYLREDVSPYAPATLYGVAKDATRRMAAALCAARGVSMAWGHIFFPFGPGEAPQRMLPSLVRVFRSEAPPFGVNVAAYRGMLPVPDAAAALATILLQGCNGNFNICSGEPSRIGDVVSTLARLCGADPAPVLALATARPGDPPMLVGDSTRLRATGWRPTLTLEQGLAAMLAPDHLPPRASV